MAYRKISMWGVMWQSAAILALAAILAFAVNFVRPNGLPLVGDWSPRGQLSKIKTVEDPVVSLEEAQALFLTQGAVFVDARPHEAYMDGHIQGALNLPSTEIDAEFSQVMSDVPPESLIITYCDGDACTLSKELAFNLSGKGYSHVRVLVNGWSAWQDAKLPVDKGSN